MDDDHISDRIAIEELKARYFRYVDTKQWDAWRGLFTDDFTFYNEKSSVPGDTAPMATDADTFVAIVAASQAHTVTVHHGHLPEITFTGDDTAIGIWAMFDWVHDPVANWSRQGFGHYHDLLVRGEDGQWRLAEVRLTRLRTDTVTTMLPNSPTAT